MARKRYITTDISLSGKVEELGRRAGEYAIILWTWMIPHFDDWGRMEGQADKIFFTVTPRFSLLGRTPEDAEKALQAMVELGLIERYEVGGNLYIQVNRASFYELQTYIPQSKRLEDKSNYPPPPDDKNGRAAGQDPGGEQPGEQRARTPFKSLKQERMFDRFWEAYPKKRSKGQAEKTWTKIQPSEQLLATMLATIERAKTSEDWTKEGGKYIPYPSTWLNAKGWEDDYSPKEAKKHGPVSPGIQTTKPATNYFDRSKFVYQGT